MMMSELKVITEFNDEIIKQCLAFQGSSLTPRVEDIIKLKEQGVKEALSKLGYLNPDEAKELKRERDEALVLLERWSVKRIADSVIVINDTKDGSGFACRDHNKNTGIAESLLYRVAEAFLDNQNTDKE